MGNSMVNSSIYETNNYFLKNKFTSLIEYAVFYGSNQIFKYLSQNGAELKPSLWIYAVHGQNKEVIHFLEENQIFPTKNYPTFEQIFNESIKCHHFDVANYIQNNYLQNENEYSNTTSIISLKYYNFMFMRFDINNKTLFYYLCRYDYYIVVHILLEKKNIDVNKKIICIVFFYAIFKFKNINDICGFYFK